MKTPSTLLQSDASDLAGSGTHLESGVLAGRKAGEGEGPVLPGRYEDLGAVAEGAFGEVRRVRDTWLDRVLAMNVDDRADP